MTKTTRRILLTAILSTAFLGTAWFAVPTVSAQSWPPTCGTQPCFFANAVSACRADLAWMTDQNPGAGFNVRYMTTSPITEAGSTKLNVVGTSRSTTINSLSPSTHYYFDIQYVYPNASRLVSSPEFVTTVGLPSAPGAPTALGISSSGSGGTATMSLVFASSTDLSPRFAGYGGMKIERRAGGAGAWTTLYDLSNADRGYVPTANGKFFYDDGGVDMSTYYTYRASLFESDAGCAVGSRRYSGTAEITVPTRTGDGDFALSYRFDPATRTSQAVLLWSAATQGQTKFEVWRKAEGEANFSLLASPDAAATGYNDTALSANVQYAYKVRACAVTGGATGCSAFTPEHSIVAASAPQDFKGRVVYVDTSAKTADLHFDWMNTFPNENYRLYRASGNAPTFVAAGIPVLEADPVKRVNGYATVPIYDTYRFYASSTQSPDPSLEAAFDLGLSYVLRGSAWASGGGTVGNPKGVGWVSFNADTPVGGSTASPTNKYSVQVTRATGELSGLAWATVNGGKGYGWISFNEADLDGCPDGTPTLCRAVFDEATNQFRGWGRFIAPQGGSGDSKWDGWVSLSNVKVDGIDRSVLSSAHPYSLARIVDAVRAADGWWGKTRAAIGTFVDLMKVYAAAGTNYGVLYNAGTGKLTGAAWGNDVAGWIAFSDTSCPSGGCDVYANPLNNKPVASNVRIETGTLEPQREGGVWCSVSPYYNVWWDYTDGDGDPQTMARIEFVKVSDNSVSTSSEGTNADLGLAEYLSGGQYRYAAQNPLGYSDANDTYATTGALARNALYRARVSVFDGEEWSNPALSDATTTPPYYYPFAEFNWSPRPAPKQVPITFDSTPVRDRSAGASSIDSLDWRFPHGTPAASTEPSPVVSYNRDAVPTDETSLQVTDGNGKTCAVYYHVIGEGQAPTGSSPGTRYFQEK